MLDTPAAPICAQEYRPLHYFVPVFSSVFIIDSTIWSMLKLADRWLGGNSLKV